MGYVRLNPSAGSIISRMHASFQDDLIAAEQKRAKFPQLGVRGVEGDEFDNSVGQVLVDSVPN